MGTEARISTDLKALLWPSDPDNAPIRQRWMLSTGRMLYAVGRDLIDGRLTLHATSLAYTTLLSLVPLLAVSFSVLKGFGVHNQLEPVLLEALHPLGSEAQEIVQHLINYVDNTDVRVLGSVGVAVLLYSVLSLISKIERVFNDNWRIDEPRPIGERFTRYLSVLLVGPVLFFSAVGATASLRTNLLFQRAVEIEPVSWAVDSAEQMVPLLLITLTFVFAYMFVPNTRVRLRSALIGGLVAGVLWEVIGQFFAMFMAGSTKYAAIYSSLAILILFMMWVYIAWLILLVGAAVAFYNQYPEYLGTGARGLRLSNRLRERLALMISARIAARHFDGSPPCTADGLSHELGIPTTNVRNLLKILQQGDIIVRTADKPPRYVPAHAPETLTLEELLRAVRRWGEDSTNPISPPPTPAIDALDRQLTAAAESVLGPLTLKDLAEPPAETNPAADKR